MRRKRKITKISDLPSGPPTQAERIERAKAQPIDNVINDSEASERRVRDRLTGRDITGVYTDDAGVFPELPQMPFARLSEAFRSLGQSMSSAADFAHTSRRLAQVHSRTYPEAQVDNPNLNIIADAIHNRLPHVGTDFLKLHLRGIVNRIAESGAAYHTEAIDYLLSEVSLDTWVDIYGNMARDHKVSFGPFISTGYSVEFDLTFRITTGS